MENNMEEHLGARIMSGFIGSRVSPNQGYILRGGPTNKDYSIPDSMLE